MDSDSPSSQLKNSLRKYTAALARSPRNPRILEEMADVLVQLERRHEGLSCYLNSGQCYLEKKKFREAAAVFRKVLELEPSHAKAMEGITAAEREEIRTVVGGPRRKPRPEEDGDAWHQKVKGGKPVVVVPKGGQPGEASAITVMDPPATGELYDPSIQDAETLCLEDEQGNKREPGWGTINKGWEDEEEEQFPLTNTQEIYDDDVVEEEDLDETGVREPEAPHDPMDLADTIVDMPDEDIDFDEDDEELAATRPHEVVVQRPPPECDEVVVQPPLPEDDEEGEQPTLESDDDLDLDELFSGQGLGDEIVELTHVTPRPMAPKRVATVRDEPSDIAPLTQPLPLPAEFRAAGQRMTFEPGQIIFAERERSTNLYLLKRGRVEIHKEVRNYGGHEGSVRRLATLEEESCFGIFGLLGDGNGHVTVRAVEQSEVIMFTKRQLKTLMRNDAEVNKAARKLYRDTLMETLIKTSPLLRPLSHASATRLIDLCKPRKYSRGDVVFRQGDRTGGLYLVLIGTLEVTRADAESEEEMLLRRLMDGDFFGGISLIRDRPASATDTARTFSQLFHIRPNDFYEFASEVPEVLSVVESEANRRDMGFQSIMEGEAQYEVGTTVYLLDKKKEEEEE